MSKLKKRLAVVSMVGGLLFAYVPATYAAPVSCPNGQTAQKVDGGWACVNGGNNTTGACSNKGGNNKCTR
jgi:hypothetical protein